MSCTGNDVFNPAAEEFSYGDKVYNPKKKLAGVAMGSQGTIVTVRYYNNGYLSKFDEPTSMQDLVNNSKK